MEIVREKGIEFFGKKEKVKVLLDIPIPPNKTQKELVEEYGDIGFVDENVNEVMEEVFGAIANQFLYCIYGMLYSRSEFGSAAVILSENIRNAGIDIVNILEARKDAERMR